MKRVLVVVTARPSYSRIRSALVALCARGADPLVVAAASALVTRFGRVVDQIRADGFEVAEEVPSVLDEDTLENSARSTGYLTGELAGAFRRLRPDVVVTIADRHETLATAIAASYQHIPLCHVQGGEVTGSIDDKVRNAVTQLADVHCVSTLGAAKRVGAALGWDCVTDQGLVGDLVIWAGKRGGRMHVTGCPSIDLAAEAVALGPIHRADIIVLQHPVTDEVDQAGAQMRATIEAVGPEALYLWPGEDAGGSAMAKELRLAGIHPVRNLPPVEFLRVLFGARALVGNSSVGIRECSYMGVPVVNIGSRQQGRECSGNVVHVRRHDADSICAGLQAIEHNRERMSQPSALYGDGRAGERIADVLLGYAREAAV